MPIEPDKNQKRRAYYNQVKDTLNAKRRERYKLDSEYRERLRRQKSSYYQKTKEVAKERAKNYYYENRDKRLVQISELQKQKREQINQWRRNRERDVPEFKLANNIRKQVCKALSRNQKSCKSFDLIGCSPLDLRQHLEQHFDSRMSWENYGSYWHVDHIRPLASFDLSDPDQQKRAFHWSNLQPLSASENRKKGAFYEEPSETVMDALRPSADEDTVQPAA